MRPTPIKPKPGQESVWDYPRPPRLEATKKHIIVRFNEVVIADTKRAYRVLETSHPPGYYMPPEDINMAYLVRGNGRSWCEWKGQARYYSVVVNGKEARDVAWYYPAPTPPFANIKNYVAFYVAPMDVCTVDGEIVRPQPGQFYGGWVTDDIVGPFKGEPRTRGW